MKEDFAVKLFNKSPLKQRKYKVLTTFLNSENLNGKTILDIGSDNGVISLLLRQAYKNANWYSGDLTQETCDLIKDLVKENVVVLGDKEKFCFEDKKFDDVVIVDFLEHINDDKFVINEITRILKDDGTLIINVPNPVRGLVRFLKIKTGQTDKAHGHIRRGYTLDEIKNLTKENFEVVSFKTYGRGFSDFIDFLIIFSLKILKRKNKNKETKKGTLVSKDDLNKFNKVFKLYSLLYPFFKFFVFLDSLFFFLPCNMLTVKLKRK